MKKKAPLNKTTLVVRDAMKAVSKEVRASKCVRDKKVKPLYLKQTERPKVLSMTLGKIKFKEKEVLNYPAIGQQFDTSVIWDDVSSPPKYMGYITRRMVYSDIEMELRIKATKIQKLNKLFHKGINLPIPKIVDLIFETSINKIYAKGYLISIATHENGNVTFGFKPHQLVMS